jgi:pyruvate formate lyase activating enzyme
MVYYEYKCMGCNKCVDLCSQNALTKTKQKLIRDYTSCSSCGSCADICPTASQQILGQNISSEELVEALEKDRLFFESSSGGVTFSGGEPLMQPGFLTETLKRCQTRGIHTTLDTSGYALPAVFTTMLKYTDLVLYDLKLFDEHQHRKYTGVSNTRIIKNLDTILEKRKAVILRFPAIQGITNTEENLKALLDYVSSLKGITAIDVLPFHNVQEKYLRLGKDYKLSDLQSSSPDDMRIIKEQCEQRGLYVRIGG